ncbi:ABC transporter substrate-binding protein [Pigmentiphaga soli]|uniref:ABC transporter substrate-binding protein n=1 Tax=Pigmentiphaga soli TaxID=1007095 RepID=A0ABP8HB78_9BURK
MNRSIVRTGLAIMALGLNLYAAAPASAQSAAELASMYQGPDREQKLLEGARKEGGLTLYTSMSGHDLDRFLAAFTNKYGIKVNDWRAGSEGVLQRALTEARARRLAADIADNNVAQMEALRREGLLQKVDSPWQKSLMPEAVPAHKEWVGNSIDMIVQAYNSNKFKKEDLPRKWEDLLDPKWKGQLGMEVSDQAWFGTIVDYLGHDKGMKLFEDIADKNGISVRKGHTLLANMVASGEVPLALTVYDYSPAAIRKKGGPIESFVIEPAVGAFRSIGMLRNAPHPYSALLFYDFVISKEGQQMLKDFTRVPTNTQIDSPWKDTRITFIDPGKALDMDEQWTREYETAVTKRAK